MAKLNYVPSFIGTRDGICIYFMYGNFYVRAARKFDGNRIKTDKEFTKTKEQNDIMGLASKLSSSVYNTIPKKKRDRSLFQAMTGRAINMLNKGVPENEIIKTLTS